MKGQGQLCHVSVAAVTGGGHYSLARQSLSILRALRHFYGVKSSGFSSIWEKSIQNLWSSVKERKRGPSMHTCLSIWLQIYAHSCRMSFVWERDVPRNIALSSLPSSSFPATMLRPSPSSLWHFDKTVLFWGTANHITQLFWINIIRFFF